MENRLQHLLLICKACLFGAGLCVPLLATAQNDSGKIRTNSELFDIGVFTGVINIEDFPAEFVVGASVTFKASEDFFLQYNYLQSDVSESSFEANDAFPTLELDDRTFTHYDLLVGYNVFQGEFFSTGDKSHLSSLYIVGGIGDTDFGGEENFTYTVGVGYQIEFVRRYILRFDFRDYIYRSSLIVGGDDETVHNTQFSLGFGYLF